MGNFFKILPNSFNKCRVHADRLSQMDGIGHGALLLGHKIKSSKAACRREPHHHQHHHYHHYQHHYLHHHHYHPHCHCHHNTIPTTTIMTPLLRPCLLGRHNHGPFPSLHHLMCSGCPPSACPLSLCPLSRPVLRWPLPLQLQPCAPLGRSGFGKLLPDAFTSCLPSLSAPWDYRKATLWAL